MYVMNSVNFMRSDGISNSVNLGMNNQTMPSPKTKLFAYVNLWKSKANWPKKL